jgi:hypothetical protein
MVTMAPTAALEGLKLVIVGVGNTVKFVALLSVILLVVIEIFPVNAPAGTFVVRLVEVAVKVWAVVPLNFITLFSGADVLKFVPVIITVAPTAPLIGVKLVKVGVGSTVKSEELVPVIPPTVTVIFPVVAPLGTVVVMLVDVDAVTTAVVPLNFTTLLAGVV